MKHLIKYIWQLPQNLLGFLVILFTKAVDIHEDGIYITSTFPISFGVSLGDYIIFSTQKFPQTWQTQHEKGHRKQSEMLGPLYLIVIGLPSITYNIYDRIHNKNKPYLDRYYWYHSLPWEKWADRLGNV